MAYLGETLRQAQGDTLGPTFEAKLTLPRQGGADESLDLYGGRLEPALNAAEGMGVISCVPDPDC